LSGKAKLVINNYYPRSGRDIVWLADIHVTLDFMIHRSVLAK